ncbi:hypothetical protein HOI83_04095 [Candidatus Uhrbacteria bacterium]|jgi:ankyrin repeat protein|nr:hypothetical protein [Candidatus Uhrbacteria bacterium]
MTPELLKELNEYATEGNAEKLEEMARGDINVDDVSISYRFPALHYAIRVFPHNPKKDTLACVKVLIDAGADPFATYRGGESPFATACIEGQLDIVKFFFLEGDPELDLRLDAGTSLLDEIAIKLKNRPINVSNPTIAKAVDDEAGAYLKIAELLIKKGADVDSLNKNKQGALHTASGSGVTSMVELLLEHGAKVDHKDSKGLTSLHYASRKGFISTMNALIKAGADVNAQDDWGFTPSHEAIMSNDFKSIELLVVMGADMSIGLTKAYDKDTPVGCTPRDLKQAKSNPDIKKIVGSPGKKFQTLKQLKEELNTPVKEVVKEQEKLEFKDIPFKDWNWDKTEFRYHGASVQHDAILWYTHSEDHQGGGASNQTCSDYIHNGCISIKPPAKIDKEIREYIMEYLIKK